jgi:diguanylate cyclase (GGDEF)-like protein
VSFRGRLTLFFLLIVILPMIAVGVLAVDVTNDARDGKADARLVAGLETANAIYRRQAEEAEAVANAIGRDPELGEALMGGDDEELNAVIGRLAEEQNVEAVQLFSPDTELLAAYGSPDPVAGIERELRDPSTGQDVGTLLVSTTTPDAYLDEVKDLTSRDGVLYGDAGRLASTMDDLPRDFTPPSPGDSTTVDVDGDELRSYSLRLPEPNAPELTLFGPIESGSVLSSSPLVWVALVGFFGVALLFVMLLLRTLQGQVGTMLEAARRIGGGDFSQEVPVIGRDEMAGLADEFNKMSDRLAEQMDQLRRQQVQIDRSVRRIGEASAAGLDREALLEILAETAVGACDAEYGLIALSGREGAEAEVGQAFASESIQDAVLAAEAQADRSSELSEESADGAFALAGPLRRLGEPPVRLGVITVARSSRPFNAAERDVFLYLIGQAAASIENVALHEQVSEQAVTDDLTGLANKRAFAEQAAKEAARAERFGHPLSLLMLDIDDFKQVNDTYGHLQGDEVLRRVAAVLEAESRGVDEPARYGGEEFVVALPETDADGAVEFAERVRSRIELEEIPFVEGNGRQDGGADPWLSVTASVGVSSMPGSARDLETLIAAADAALYVAKRAGKNRVEVAPGDAARVGAEDPRAAPPEAAEATQGKAQARRT